MINRDKRLRKNAFEDFILCIELSFAISEYLGMHCSIYCTKQSSLLLAEVA